MKKYRDKEMGFDSLFFNYAYVNKNFVSDCNLLATTQTTATRYDAQIDAS